jgi:integrase
MRRYFYDRFVKHWPDLEEWFAAPLLARLDLSSDGAPSLAPGGKRTGPAYDAGSYLTYLALVHRMPMDADWVLSRNFDSVFNPRVAPALGVDLDLLNALDQRQQQLGYSYGRSLLTWAIGRLIVWRGDPDITAIGYEDVTGLAEEVRRWCARPEAPLIRACHVHSTRRNHDPGLLASQFERQCLTQLLGLHVLLFNTGQISREPMHGLRPDVIWKLEAVPADTPPAIAAPIDRWLSGRLQTTDRTESVRGARDAFRYLLRWLACERPQISSLTELTREDIEGYLAHLHDRTNPRTGRPLAARTRYSYISPLLIFFQEASQWGWEDVPSRPLLGRSDLPKLPARLPRFIPRGELDRLMKAVEDLEDPYQRTALLLVRWSGARRGEIRCLTINCLDSYPDGYPRLRIPVGKTYTERMIPLHPQAADALRDLIERARAAGAAARYDTWAQQLVRWVFMRRADPDHHGDPRPPQRDDVRDVLPHQRPSTAGTVRESNRSRRPPRRPGRRSAAGQPLRPRHPRLAEDQLLQDRTRTRSLPAPPAGRPLRVRPLPALLEVLHHQRVRPTTPSPAGPRTAADPGCR